MNDRNAEPRGTSYPSDRRGCQMVSAYDIIDKFNGMISKEQAESVLGAHSSNIAALRLADNGMFDVASLNALLISLKEHPTSSTQNYTVNVSDRIYRIFNPTPLSEYSQSKEKRTIVLGREGNSIAIALFGKASEFIDLNAFERNDTITIKNIILNTQKSELQSNRYTVLSKIHQSMDYISNFSILGDGQRNINLIGSLVEISPIRYVGKQDSKVQVATSRAIIFDGKMTLPLSLWGSSALATAKFNLNSYAKLEFCNVLSRDGKLEVQANDSSRIFTSDIFKRRFKK